MRRLLKALDIGQHNVMEIFAVKRNIFSEISKVLLNDVLQNLMEAVGLRVLLTD